MKTRKKARMHACMQKWKQGSKHACKENIKEHKKNHSPAVFRWSVESNT